MWFSGFENKKGIFQTKLTSLDKQRLEDVKKAIEENVISTQVESLRNFTKTHALKLYKVLAEVTRASTIAEMVNNCPKNYHCVTEVETFNDMLEKALKEDYIGLDTETTGLDVFGKDLIVGVSISLPEHDEHFYIPVRHEVPEEQLPEKVVFEGLKPLIESEKIGKVLHNAKFDAHMFKKEGITLTNIIMDTMNSFHVLTENEPSYALKNIATKWGKNFGFIDSSKTYEELFGKGGFEKTPLDIGTVYACKDTHLTINLYKWIMSHLEKQEGLLATHQLETKILPVVIEMGQNGIS